MAPYESTPEEEMLLLHVGIAAFGVIAASLGVWWLAGAQWLIEHRVLVAASADPLLVVPGTEGAGLDASRAAVAVGLLVALLVAGVDATRRRWADGRAVA